MHSLKRLAAAVALTTAWAGLPITALSAESGTVDAQVIVATPCIIVSPTALDFGTLSFTTIAVQGYSPRAIQLQNCGNSPEQMYVRGTDATVAGTTVWSLVPADPCSGGLNEYFLRARDNSNTGPFVGLDKTDQFLETVGAGSIGLTNELQLVMPCTGSDGAGQTVNFQAVFTATF